MSILDGAMGGPGGGQPGNLGAKVYRDGGPLQLHPSECGSRPFPQSSQPRVQQEPREDRVFLTIPDRAGRD